MRARPSAQGLSLMTGWTGGRGAGRSLTSIRLSAPAPLAPSPVPEVHGIISSALVVAHSALSTGCVGVRWPGGGCLTFEKRPLRISKQICITSPRVKGTRVGGHCHRHNHCSLGLGALFQRGATSGAAGVWLLLLPMARRGHCNAPA